ncbi:MAG: prepilin-type N-terminal cleavage/methylation protein [Naasia sp.]|nr:prepilin-type N-terminal cleavage/methylation protein [Naasia sp.]
MVDLRSVLRDNATQDDDGFTLVEVIVAMMVFALIALGVGYSTLTTIRLSADTRARETATNLAASEIDAVRAIGDPFAVLDEVRTRTIAGTEFTVRRDAGWVTGPDTSNDCGVGTGTLKYKRVNVQVSWPRALGDAPVAAADTIISPKTRLNDPAFGSILVSVAAADGTGAPGVSVSIVPTSGGAALTTAPAATDADGCTFAFKVAPGTYKVSISRPGGIDETQQATPNRSVSVLAGGAGSAAFQYDTAGSFTVRYADGANPAPLLPSLGFSTSWFSSYGVVAKSGAPAVVSLHPFASGYRAAAGTYVSPSDSSTGCIAVDPGSWPAGTVAGKPLAAGAQTPAVAAEPGGSATADVRLGTVLVTAEGAASVRAVPVLSGTADPATGYPGCSVANTLRWDAVPAAGSVALGLPYGAWTIQELKNGVWVDVAPARLTVSTNAADPVVTGPVVTVDPRGLA